MTPGKMVSQAGHAFLGSFLQSEELHQAEYHSAFPTSPGTKVALKVKDLSQLEEIRQELERSGVPTYTVVDSGHMSFHDGQPTITALGVGPVQRCNTKPLKRLKLL